MSQFREYLERSAASELNNPFDIEEQHRETQYPDVCTPECEHVTCGYRREENRGKPCFMKWKQSENKPQSLPHTQRKTSYSESYSLTQKIEKLVAKILEPLDKRLREIEQTPEYHAVQRSITFNGQRTRLDIGTNQERINHD